MKLGSLAILRSVSNYFQIFFTLLFLICFFRRVPVIFHLGGRTVYRYLSGIFRSNQWHGTAPLSQSLSRIILNSDFLAPVLSADRQSNETVHSCRNRVKLYMASSVQSMPFCSSDFRGSSLKRNGTGPQI